MNQPEVRPGECIWVGNRKVCVLRILDNGDIYVGYFQYPGTRGQKPYKPIGETVIWEGDRWSFKVKSVSGGYIDEMSQEASMMRDCL